MTREEILNELKNISAKADDLCEHIFDLKMAILGNWHKVADGDLPNKRDGEQIYLCQIADNNGKLKDLLLCCYYCGKFVNHISLKPMSYNDNVIAWMEIPEYKE